jgi:hypothetical protein
MSESVNGSEEEFKPTIRDRDRRQASAQGERTQTGAEKARLGQFGREVDISALFIEDDWLDTRGRYGLKGATSLSPYQRKILALVSYARCMARY